MLKLILYLNLVSFAFSLKLVHEWKYIDYTWSSPEERQRAIDSGEYNLTSNVINDADKADDGRFFVAIARSPGVPSTLSVVSGQMGEGGLLLSPYPDWEWNNRSLRNCDAIISTYRNFIKCNKLYVIDNGYIGDDKICDPKLLIFDLETDQLEKRVDIPAQVAVNKINRGVLLTPIVLQESCYEPPVVFMADNEGYGVVLWDSGRNLFRRFDGELFTPKPEAVNMTINGETVAMRDGIIGLAVAPDASGAQKLWFHPTSSFDMSAADVHEMLYEKRIRYITARNILPSQTIASASSRAGTVFMGLVEPPSIICYNTHTELRRENLVTVAEDREKLQFAGGVKVIEGVYGEELYVLTNRYQKYYVGKMNFNETNIRLMKGEVQELIKGTKCEI